MMFHRICRVCIIGLTVITWAYQFVGMLPVSMCYAGGPCGTLKCALLTVIAMPNRSANFMPSAQCMVWTGILAFMCMPGDLGTTLLCGSSGVSYVGVGGGVAECFLLDPHIPLPIPEPSPSFRISPTPSFWIAPAPLSEFYPPPFYEFYLPSLAAWHLPPLSEFYPPPFYEFYLPPSE